MPCIFLVMLQTLQITCTTANLFWFLTCFSWILTLGHLITLQRRGGSVQFQVVAGRPGGFNLGFEIEVGASQFPSSQP